MELKVEEVIRLGKRHPESDESSKPRPLKIVLDTEKNKIQVIRRAKKLEGQKGWRMGESVRTSGPNTKTEERQTQAGADTEDHTSSG